MTLQEKIAAMESCRGHNRPLPALRRLLDQYLPEHKKLELIQVAGTNGKGSTSAWLSALLQKDGFQTGTFTSPHLVSHFERMAINGKPIPAADWEKIYDLWKPLFEKERFTMFEMDLWMALTWFISEGVDVAILEAGLGGRQDATTALDYKATLVTNVGLDHMEYLGDTKEKIAWEKAGVFSRNTPALTAESAPEVLAVLQREASRIGTKLERVALAGTESGHFMHLAIGSEFVDWDLLRVPRYQLGNFALALGAMESCGYPVHPEDVQEVIDHFCWPGRFEMLRSSPCLLLDGAHNVPGISALVQSLKVFSGNIYFSVLKDKQARTMIRHLQSLDCPLTLVAFDSCRLGDLEGLEKEFGLPVISIEQLMDTLQTTDTPALVCGSLYLIGEVKKRWSA